MGSTVCLGRRAGLAVERDTGPFRARLVSLSRSIQPVGWTVCLGLRVGLAVMLYAGPTGQLLTCRALAVRSWSAPQVPSRPWDGPYASDGRQASQLSATQALAASSRSAPQVPSSSWAGPSALDGGPVSPSCVTQALAERGMSAPQVPSSLWAGLYASDGGRALPLLRYAGPGHVRQVSSSSSIQSVGWTVCLGWRAGLAVVRDAGPGCARRMILKFHPASGLDRLLRTTG